MPVRCPRWSSRPTRPRREAQYAHRACARCESTSNQRRRMDRTPSLVNPTGRFGWRPLRDAGQDEARSSSHLSAAWVAGRRARSRQRPLEGDPAPLLRAFVFYQELVREAGRAVRGQHRPTPSVWRSRSRRAPRKHLQPAGSRTRRSSATSCAIDMRRRPDHERQLDCSAHIPEDGSYAAHFPFLSFCADELQSRRDLPRGQDGPPPRLALRPSASALLLNGPATATRRSDNEDQEHGRARAGRRRSARFFFGMSAPLTNAKSRSGEIRTVAYIEGVAYPPQSAAHGVLPPGTIFQRLVLRASRDRPRTRNVM